MRGALQEFGEKHHANLRLLEKAIKSVQLELRRYISVGDENRCYIQTKVLSHLISSWAEVRVLRLAYERSAFAPDEISAILSAATLRDKWLTALQIAVCKAYHLPVWSDPVTRLAFTPRQRFQALVAIINQDLLDSYEVRNRIAHGQWFYAFTNDLSAISTDLTGKLRTENIVQLQLKLKLFRSLAQTIHDLAVSPPTFERDFDRNYRVIEEQKTNFHNRTFAEYKQKMVEKYQRGLKKRRRVAD
jgi:hypothetical protein